MTTTDSPPSSKRHVPDGAIALIEVINSLKGRVSYRVVDYWIREGMIRLSHPGSGSGSLRCVTPAERLAILRLVETYERAQRDLARLRSGSLFNELLAWNDITDQQAS